MQVTWAKKEEKNPRQIHFIEFLPLQFWLLAENLKEAEAHAHLFMNFNTKHSHKNHTQRNGRNVDSHLNKAKWEFPKITQLEYFAPEDS